MGILKKHYKSDYVFAGVDPNTYRLLSTYTVLRGMLRTWLLLGH